MSLPKKIKKVEDLANFPFKNFQEFKKASTERVAYPQVDRGVALDWSRNGIYTSRFIRTQAIILVLLPLLVAIGFIIYALASKSWLLLLALPVLFIGFVIFHPSSAMAFGFIRSGFILLTFLGFIWALLAWKIGLLALTIALLVIWYAQKNTYGKAVRYLIRAVVEHEDLLCLLWQAKVLSIKFYNGNSYWVNWKFEDGKDIDYEK